MDSDEKSSTHLDSQRIFAIGGTQKRDDSEHRKSSKKIQEMGRGLATSSMPLLKSNMGYNIMKMQQPVAAVTTISNKSTENDYKLN